MDEEKNIVQTVLKANNTFKDFSPSLLTHRKLLLVPAAEGNSQLYTQQPSIPEMVCVCVCVCGGGVIKRKKVGLMQMRLRGRLSVWMALEQKRVCACV